MSFSEDLQKLASSKTELSTDTLRLLGIGLNEEILHRDGHLPGVEERMKVSEAVEADFQAAADYLQKEYRRGRERFRHGVDEAREGVERFNRTFEKLGSFFDAPIATATIGLMGEASDWMVRDTIDKFEHRHIREIKDVIVTELAVLEKDGLIVAKDLLKRPAEEINDELVRLTRRLYKDLDVDMIEELRNGSVTNALRVGAIEIFTDAVDRTLDKVKSTVGKPLSDIVGVFNRVKSAASEIEEKFGQHRRGLEELVTKVSGIEESAKEFVKELEEGAKEIAANGKNVKLLSKLVYERLTAEQRRLAFQQGWVLKPEEDEDGKPNDDEGWDAERIVGEINRYAEWAKTASKLADKLGVDKKLIGKVNEVANLAQKLGAAYLAFPANPVGAVMSLTKLTFGSSVVDVGAMRHAQIMQSFGQVMQKLDQVISRIESLERTVMALHRDLVDRLREINHEIGVNRGLIRDLRLKPLRSAQHFIESRATSTAYGFSPNGFQSWNGLRAHFSDYVDKFQDGVLELETVVRSEPVDSLFHSSTHVEGDENRRLLQRKNRTFATCYGILAEMCETRNLDFAQATVELLTPSRSMYEMDSKLESLDAVVKGGSQLANHPRDFLTRTNGRLLYTDIIHEVALCFAESHFYYQLLPNVNENSLPRIEKAVESTRSERGKIALGHTMDLINSAIAQQSLLSGDLIIPFIYDRLRGVDWSNPDSADRLQRAMVSILPNSVSLTRNLISYAFYRESGASSLTGRSDASMSAIIATALNLKSREEPAWNGLLANDWPLVRDPNREDDMDEGWFLRVADMEGQTDSAVTFRHVSLGTNVAPMSLFRMQYQSDKDQLVRDREMIATKLSGYDLLATVDSAHQPTLRLMALWDRL